MFWAHAGSGAPWETGQRLANGLWVPNYGGGDREQHGEMGAEVQPHQSDDVSVAPEHIDNGQWFTHPNALQWEQAAQMVEEVLCDESGDQPIMPAEIAPAAPVEIAYAATTGCYEELVPMVRDAQLAIQRSAHSLEVAVDLYQAPGVPIMYLQQVPQLQIVPPAPPQSARTQQQRVHRLQTQWEQAVQMAEEVLRDESGDQPITSAEIAPAAPVEIAHAATTGPPEDRVSMVRDAQLAMQRSAHRLEVTVDRYQAPGVPRMYRQRVPHRRPVPPAPPATAVTHQQRVRRLQLQLDLSGDSAQWAYKDLAPPPPWGYMAPQPEAVVLRSHSKQLYNHNFQIPYPMQPPKYYYTTDTRNNFVGIRTETRLHIDTDSGPTVVYASGAALNKKAAAQEAAEYMVQQLANLRVLHVPDHYTAEAEAVPPMLAHLVIRAQG